jgi:hypothetical protein
MTDQTNHMDGESTASGSGRGFEARLRSLLEGLPSGQVIQVTAPVDEIRAHLASRDCGAGTEWSLEDLARRFDREPGTVAEWCKKGIFSGAWQDEAGHWRVPAASVQAYIRSKQEEAAARAAELQRGKELARQRRRAGAPEKIPNPQRPNISGWRDKLNRG